MFCCGFKSYSRRSTAHIPSFSTVLYQESYLCTQTPLFSLPHNAQLKAVSGTSCTNCKHASKLTCKKTGNEACLHFFIMKYSKLYWIMVTTIHLLLGNKSRGQFIRAQEKVPNTEGHSLRAEPPSKNIYDVPELPFFFLDKDSICHRAIYSLRVRISMISSHSASLRSPWHHLCNS